MEVSGEVADLMLKEGLEAAKIATELSAKGLVNVAALLAAIIGNADTMIYLGGNEQSTHKYISEQLGKETISTKSSSQSKGRNGSYSQSTQLTGRELMTPDEVRLLDNKNAIVIIRGERPVIDEKYDLMKHPNIRFTEDGGAAPYVHSPHCLYDMRYLLSTIETEESV